MFKSHRIISPFNFPALGSRGVREASSAPSHAQGPPAPRLCRSGPQLFSPGFHSWGEQTKGPRCCISTHVTQGDRERSLSPNTSLPFVPCSSRSDAQVGSGLPGTNYTSRSHGLVLLSCPNSLSWRGHWRRCTGPTVTGSESPPSSKQSRIQTPWGDGTAEERGGNTVQPPTTRKLNPKAMRESSTSPSITRRRCQSWASGPEVCFPSGSGARASRCCAHTGPTQANPSIRACAGPWAPHLDYFKPRASYVHGTKDVKI